MADPVKTVYSIASVASWSDPSHWSYTTGGASCSCTPDENKDIIYVETNTSSASNLTFGASVTLVIRNNSTLTVNGEVIFSNGSNIILEAGSQWVIIGNLKNKNNSNEIIVDGILIVDGEFTGENGSVINGTGSMSTTGAATTTGTGKVFGFNNDCNPGPCFTNASTPLPVVLLSFTAECDNTKVVLKWSTASEINNNYFVIERSENSIDFETIGQVKGAGNSNSVSNYSFTDKDIRKGTFYYRLKQVDYNGVNKYLDIKAVSNIGEGSSCDLIIKPNPCVGKCEISLENCTEEEFQDARIMLFDALGNAVYSSMSKQIVNGKATFELDNTNYLRPAVYIVRGLAGKKIKKTKQVLINK